MIMNAEPYLEQSMQEGQIREALNTDCRASAAGDAEAEHDIYADDAICDYPLSGERILGEAICTCGVIILASRLVLTLREFAERAICGSPNMQSPIRGRPAYTVSIMESATVRLCTRLLFARS
jgi:hypothetical protein